MSVSVRDIVERLGRTGIDTSMLSERVRHWTREKLLDPEGEERPGTGRKRLYGSEAVREAALLNRLAEMGVSVRNMHLAMAGYRDGRHKVDAALSDKQSPSTVLLWLNVDRRGLSPGVAVVEHANPASTMDDMSALFAGTDSTLIINLSRTFAGL